MAEAKPIPPSPDDQEPKPVSLPTVDVSVPSTRRNFTRPQKLWSASAMEGAIHDGDENDMSVRRASKKWAIPVTIVTKWLGGLTTTSKKGPTTILTVEEEEEIVEWCQQMAVVGHGLEILNLKEIVV